MRNDSEIAETRDTTEGRPGEDGPSLSESTSRLIPYSAFIGNSRTDKGSIDLFHVSEIVYARGALLSPFNGPSRYQQAQHARGHMRLEDVFEIHRPADCVSRIGAYFTFPTVTQCGTFVRGDPRYASGGKTPRYYRERTTRCTAAPMALVDCVANHGAQAAALPSTVAEYWQPQHRWKFIEYLCINLTIIKEIAPPHPYDIAGATFALWEDVKKRQQIWP